MKEIIKNINKLWFHKGHLNEDQRDFLINILKEIKPKFCIETGFASGRSAITTLNAAEPELLISIDINLDYISGARLHSEKIKENFNNFKLIEGSSSKILTDDFFNDNFPHGIEFAFIDGDHSYAGAYSDIERVYAKINNGGIMIVDDYMSGPPNGARILSVNNAVNDFAEKNNIKIERWESKGKGFAIFRK
jgi:predicted O-methyltransferase YrrM